MHPESRDSLILAPSNQQDVSSPTKKEYVVLLALTLFKVSVESMIGKTSTPEIANELYITIPLSC